MNGNLMQRTFDVLDDARTPLTCAEIAARLRLSTSAVRGALKRLRLAHRLATVYTDGIWRYGVRHGAARPDDLRGQRRT